MYVLKCETDSSTLFQNGRPVNNSSFQRWSSVFSEFLSNRLLDYFSRRLHIALTTNAREKNAPSWAFLALIFSSKQAQNLHINNCPMKLS